MCIQISFCSPSVYLKSFCRPFDQSSKALQAICPRIRMQNNIELLRKTKKESPVLGDNRARHRSGTVNERAIGKMNSSHHKSHSQHDSERIASCTQKPREFSKIAFFEYHSRCLPLFSFDWRFIFDLLHCCFAFLGQTQTKKQKKKQRTRAPCDNIVRIQESPFLLINQRKKTNRSPHVDVNYLNIHTNISTSL